MKGPFSEEAVNQEFHFRQVDFEIALRHSYLELERGH